MFKGRRRSPSSGNGPRLRYTPIWYDNILNPAVFALVVGMMAIVLSILTGVLGQYLSARLTHIRTIFDNETEVVTEQFEAFIPCFDVVCSAFSPLVESAQLWRGCLNVETGVGDNGLILSDGIGENGETYRACGNGTYVLDGSSYQDGDLMIFDSFREMWLKVTGSECTPEAKKRVISPEKSWDPVTITLDNAPIVSTKGLPFTSYANLIANPGVGGDFIIKSIVGGTGISVDSTEERLTLSYSLTTHKTESTIVYFEETFFDAYGHTEENTYGESSQKNYAYDQTEIITAAQQCDPKETIQDCSCGTFTPDEGNSRHIKADMITRQRLPDENMCKCSWLISFAGVPQGTTFATKTFTAQAHCFV